MQISPMVVHVVNCAGHDIKKRSNTIDGASLISSYVWNFGAMKATIRVYFITWRPYCISTFGHRKSKNTARPFIQPAQFVKEWYYACINSSLRTSDFYQ